MSTNNNPKITFSPLQREDCQIIKNSFEAQQWDKPMTLYEDYLLYQSSGERDVIVVWFDGAFAGYVTIVWQSLYPAFRERNIPEIVDLNVLKKFQRRGIASSLLDETETGIKNRSILAGIGFGVTRDYRAAQILYIKRGYVPDGIGLVKDYKPVVYGDRIIVDDSLVFYLIKKL